MPPLKYFKPQFPPDAFAGTAEYYVRYRIPYPKELLADLLKCSAPQQQGKLLDLASGPGRVAIPLAPFFSKVWANDIEPEMIAAGKSEALKRNVNNIEWLTGRAEELKMEHDSVDLITIGEAFHRLDQSYITDLALEWLKPGGHIAIIGCYSILSGNEPWQIKIKEIVGKWVPQPVTQNPEHYKLVLQEKGFEECNSYSFVLPHYWTVESIIGVLYSTSMFSKKVLGDKSAEFESELKAALNKISSEDRFFENIHCGYTLGKKRLRQGSISR